MKFGKTLKNNMVAEWEKKYLNYKELKRQIMFIREQLRLAGNAIPEGSQSFSDDEDIDHSGSGDDEDNERTPLRKSLGVQSDPNDMVFFESLLKNIDMINQFYMEKEAKYSERLRDLERQLIIYRKARITTKDDSGGERIRDALREVYRGFLLLKNYSTLNYTAVYKIMKKHDKKTGYKEIKRTMQFAQRQEFFRSAKHVLNYTNKIQQMYADAFTGGNLNTAKSQLFERRQSPTLSFSNTFNLGFYSGFCVPLIALTLAVVTINPSKNFTPALFYSVLPIYRAISLIILTVWLWGVSVYIFQAKRINHTIIMELHPKTQLGHHQLFKTAALLTAMWLLSFLLFMAATRRNFNLLGVSPEWYPLALVISCLLLVFCPLDLVHRPSRMWLVSHIFNVIIAPFGQVRFSEFFIGDWLTSLVKVLYDFEYIVCFYVTGDWYTDDFGECHLLNRTVAMPVLTGLPFVFRLLQCLRRFSNTKEKTHLANAIKYALGCIAVTLGSFHAEWTNYNPAWTLGRIVWASMLVTSTLCMYYWDVFIDWGLLKWRNGRLHLREEYQYGPKMLYIVPMITNLGGRFAWMMTITTQRFYVGVDPELLMFVFAFIEVCRRIQWGLLRIENEHLTNCGHFRAIKDIPLPFSEATTEPDMKQEASRKLEKVVRSLGEEASATVLGFIKHESTLKQSPSFDDLQLSPRITPRKSYRGEPKMGKQMEEEQPPEEGGGIAPAALNINLSGIKTE